MSGQVRQITAANKISIEEKNGSSVKINNTANDNKTH